MMNNQTLDKLRDLRLTGMVEAYEDQLARPAMVADLSFEERFGLLVDHEHTLRMERRLRRRLKDAKLKDRAAALEDVDYKHPRGLDRKLMASLSGCDWIRRRQNVLITGPTGCGKTFLSCALANRACRDGFTTRYYRFPRLLHALAIARADGTYASLLGKLARTDLLVLDDWGLAPMTDIDRRDLLEILDDRHPGRSTLVTSQLTLDAWHEYIDDPTLADGILDRLVHNAHKLQLRLKGESMRERLRPDADDGGR